MRWTNWHKIAEGTQWFPDDFDYEGPACYELGTGGPRGGNIQIHYVGETTAERGRITTYARSGSHLHKIIDWHLAAGWSLYYRGIACASKADAKRRQDNLLAKFEYDWNIKLNLR